MALSEGSARIQPTGVSVRSKRSPRPGQGAPPPSRQAMVYVPESGVLVRRPDRLAVEEPLEIRLKGPTGASTLGVTMRTPGSDIELVAGLLLSEGIVDDAGDLGRIAYCTDDNVVESQRYNVVTATLRRPPRRTERERAMLVSSSCGVCGTASIDALRSTGHPPIPAGPEVPLTWLYELPDRLRAMQRSFELTGAVHAAGLARANGEMLVVREDVGRHNAVDKVMGWAMLGGRLPLSDVVLVVSGRVAFEIVQKALRAGVPVVAAVSGATSLAASLAEETGITLAGFVRDRRCTVYSGPHRLTPEQNLPEP